MTQAELEYLQEHLRVLSGLYGMLAPFDAVVPYRLEMGSKLEVKGARDLYDFWGDEVYGALAQEADVVVNPRRSSTPRSSPRISGRERRRLRRAARSLLRTRPLRLAGRRLPMRSDRRPLALSRACSAR